MSYLRPMYGEKNMSQKMNCSKNTHFERRNSQLAAKSHLSCRIICSARSQSFRELALLKMKGPGVVRPEPCLRAQPVFWRGRTMPFWGKCFLPQFPISFPSLSHSFLVLFFGSSTPASPSPTFLISFQFHCISLSLVL